MEIDKRNRAELKQYFVKNAIPTEKNFADLIDAMVNQRDDGIVKLPDNPLSIEASGEDNGQKRVLHFYNKITDADPAWVLSLNPRQSSESTSARAGFNIADGAGNSRLFIARDNGRVGVGTLAPRGSVDAPQGDVWAGRTLHISAPSDGTNGGILNIYNETSKKFWHINIRANEADKLIFWRNDTTGYRAALKLAMDGTVEAPQGAVIQHIGIGTQVHGATTAPYETIQMNPAHNLRLWFGTNERFVFTNSGRLGIGRAPDQELHLYGPGNVEMRAQSSDASYIDFGTGTDGHYAYGYGNYPLRFGVNGAERMRLVSTGRLGIGTTTPRGNLDVPQGDAWVGRSLCISAASDGTNGGILNIYNETSKKFWHITLRPAEADRLIFWRNDATNYLAVLKLTMDGIVEAPQGALLNQIGIGTQVHGATSYPYETIQMHQSHNLRICFATKERFVLGNDGSFTIRFDQGYWTFQTDGNLVKCNSAGTVIWALNRVSGKWGWS